MQQADRPPVVVSRRGPPRKRRDAVAASPDLERALSAHEHATREEVERGVRAMYRAAVRLMHQVASEAWGAAGPDAGEGLRDRIVHTLARDDALRAILGQVEERHQAVGLRLDRIEGALRHLIRANRAALRGAAGQDVAAMAGRLDAVAASVAAAAEDHRRLETLSSSVMESLRATATAEPDLSAITSEIRAVVAAIGPAVAQATPSVDRVEAAAARGAERVVHTGVARVEAAVGRLARLGAALEAVPRLTDGGPASVPAPGPPGAEQRLRTLGRRLAWVSARLAAVTPTANGEAARQP